MKWTFGTTDVRAAKEIAAVAAAQYRDRGTHNGRRTPEEAAIIGLLGEWAADDLVGQPRRQRTEWDGGVDIRLSDGCTLAVKTVAAPTTPALRFSDIQRFHCAAALLMRHRRVYYLHEIEFLGWIPRHLFPKAAVTTRSSTGVSLLEYPVDALLDAESFLRHLGRHGDAPARDPDGMHRHPVSSRIADAAENC